ncbi:MAG TPA: prolyl oligopeptidase family serine peptidase [Woeseiaceae bacterium]|nr:prolyl oligopeptidase family serine peptidase [Woeseiaceae bacterium]
MNPARYLLTGLLAAATFDAAAASEPYPLEYWALREVINEVTVSPNGEQLAMLKILAREGNPILHIYDAGNLEGQPFVIDSDPMEIMTYDWASDEHIVLTLRQKVRDQIEGQNQGVYEYQVAILNLKKKAFDEFPAADPIVENLLPGKRDKIIISEQPGAEEDLSLDKAFRPRAYYEMDLDRGTKKLLIRGKLDVAQISFDPEGNPRVGHGFDAGRQEYVIYYRAPGESRWDDALRFHEDDFALWFFDVPGLDPAVPGNLVVQALNGDDKVGLWSYDPKNEKYAELLYRRSDVDVTGVRYHSNYWEHPDEIVAVSYATDKPRFEYFDEVEGATYAQLESLIPGAYYVTIESRSRDGNTLVARNLGPRDPGTYFLLHDGEFKEVGSRAPLLDPAELADLEYMHYKARDGRDLVAYVTVPNGKPPFPTVVLPHGGPHVHEVVIYDEWAQVLANNGYLVVQPQYRMSLGYGYDHFRSAFREQSEGGRAMQDDKDDAALHLVEQGLADPDRLAMFGWSYGGYAALVAASRTPQLYQCVIAGAAVADYVRQANEYPNPRGTGRIFTEDYQYKVVNPVAEVAKVNVPILLVHGSVDQRVRPRQARLYRDALDKAGKPYEYIELDGADHFYNTLFYGHQLTLYTNLIDFLANDCGPGGL